MAVLEASDLRSGAEGGASSTRRTEARIQIAMAWCGPAMAVGFAGAFVGLAGWLPPPSPTASPEELVRQFSHHTDLIRLGLVVTMFASALLVPFGAAISEHLRRIPGAHGLAVTQFCCAALLSLEFIIPPMIWQGMLYRIGTVDPETVRLLNDVSWIMFVAVNASGIVMVIATGVAILIDKSPDPVFPRWVAYFNFWVALGAVPAASIMFFKTGPFTWTGVFGLYVPLVAFSAWCVVMFVMVRRASLRYGGLAS